ELVVLEGLDAAAVEADEVVVVLAAPVDPLEPRRAAADVEALHEPLVAQQLEHAVDARDADRAPVGPEQIEDLLCAQAAVLATEQLDHGAAGTAAPVAGTRKSRRRLGDPVVPIGHESKHSHPPGACDSKNDYRSTPC